MGTGRRGLSRDGADRMPDRSTPGAWIADVDDPRTRAWFAERTARAEAALRSPARERLRAAIDRFGACAGAPAPLLRRGAHVYRAGAGTGERHPSLWRAPAGTDEWRRLLPLERIATDPAGALGALEPIDDGTAVAFTLDPTGHGRFELWVLDVASGEPTRLAWRVGSAVWAEGAGAVVFTELTDGPLRASRVVACEVATGRRSLVVDEPDPMLRLRVRRSDGGRFVLLDFVWSGEPYLPAVRETRIAPADAERVEFRTLWPRASGVEHHVEIADGGRVLALAFDRGLAGRLVTGPLDAFALEHARELLAADEARPLTGLRWAGGRAVVLARDGRRPVAVTVDPDGTAPSTIAPPLPGLALDVAPTRGAEQPELELVASSPLLPPTAVRPGGDPAPILAPPPELAGFAVRELEAVAPDGARIPVTVLAPRDGERRGVVVDVYGNYGCPYDPVFLPEALALAELGVAWAFAHVRGGGECGRPWHAAARGRTKRTSFDDLVAAIERLREPGEVGEHGVVVRGRSGGGVQVCVVANERPELLAGAIAEVPHLDLYAYQHDLTTNFALPESEEWGHVLHDREAAELLRSYCPTEQLREGPHPATLITTGLRDREVPSWQLARHVARLEALHRGEPPVLLHADPDVGHKDPSEPRARAAARARVCAFALARLTAAR